MATDDGRRPARPPAGSINERLVIAAMTLLREETPADLTVRRIAKAAGTTTMCLYTGFGSRDRLLDAVYAEGFEQLHQAMSAIAPESDPAQAVGQLMQAYRSFGLANPGLYGLLFERALPGFDPSPAVRRAALDTTFRLLGDQVGRLLSVSAEQEAAQVPAYTLWALTHGLVSLELTHARRSPLGDHEPAPVADGAAVLDQALLAALRGWADVVPAP